MKHFALLLCVLLAACASVPPREGAAPLLHDHLFAAPEMPIDPGKVFEMSAAMQRFVDTELTGSSRGRDTRAALVDALLLRGKLHLSYDSGATRTAAEAFADRAGNCLSLVIMTASFARRLGVPVVFQSVFADDAYSRSGDLYLVSGHVNLVLGRVSYPAMASRLSVPGPQTMTIDFLPADELAGQRVKPIEESTVVAMFMNNRAAEALAQGRTHDSYWWVREALRHDPGFLAGVNTLAVIYTRLGHLPEAEQALRHVLAQEPDNTSALSNLVRLLERTARPNEAASVGARLARLQPHPPFHFFDLARLAQSAGDHASARTLLLRELRLQPYQHEVHYWLAVSYGQLGERRLAARHIAKALENSTSRASHELYSAKLEKLRAQTLQ